jgi:metal-responsive CopG/Arc/MetJ family transcriptional regulator
MRNKVNLIPSGGIVICDESSMINDELYEKFMKIINENNINKSKLVESFIEKYVSEYESRIK